MIDPIDPKTSQVLKKHEVVIGTFSSDWKKIYIVFMAYKKNCRFQQIINICQLHFLLVFWEYFFVFLATMLVPDLPSGVVTEQPRWPICLSFRHRKSKALREFWIQELHFLFQNSEDTKNEWNGGEFGMAWKIIQFSN